MSIPIEGARSARVYEPHREPPPEIRKNRPDGGPAMRDGVDPPPRRTDSDPFAAGSVPAQHKGKPEQARIGVSSYNLAGGAKTEYRNDYGRTHAAAAQE